MNPFTNLAEHIKRGCLKFGPFVIVEGFPSSAIVVNYHSDLAPPKRANEWSNNVERLFN